jgi:hypothetical protein
MRLTDAQLRHVARTSDPGGATASDRTDQLVMDAASDNVNESEQKIIDVRWATEEVMRAADTVLRATREVAPGSHTAKTSSRFNIDSGPREPRKFSLPVTVPRPKRADRRPLVPFMATSLVLLVSALVGVCVLLIVERSRSWNVEASPSTSIALSEPGVAKSGATSDRPLLQAKAQAQTVAPSIPSLPEVPSVNNARAADVLAGRHAAPPANVGLRAVAPAPAAGALTRPNGSPQAVRGGETVPGNAGVAGSGPGPQTQGAGTGPARVATLVTRTGGGGGAPPQPSSLRQGTTAVGTAPGVGGTPARATSESMTACLAARPAASRLSQDEIAKLFKRGEEYMGQGRISTARLLFQRAAEACDMKAAFALGATYDPIMLKKLGVTLLDPDIATARTWYEQARRLGLSEATRQLELLSGLPN